MKEEACYDQNSLRCQSCDMAYKIFAKIIDEIEEITNENEAKLKKLSLTNESSLFAGNLTLLLKEIIFYMSDLPEPIKAKYNSLLEELEDENIK